MNKLYGRWSEAQKLNLKLNLYILELKNELKIKDSFLRLYVEKGHIACLLDPGLKKGYFW